METGNELFIIFVRHANLTRITEAMQDPYCKLSLGDQNFQTKVLEDTPTKPIWEETFKFVKKKDLILKISVWDWDSPTKSDIIGETVFDLKKFALNDKKELTIDLNYKVKKAGTITMTIEYCKEVIGKKVKKNSPKKLLFDQSFFGMVNKEFDEIKLNLERTDIWTLVEDAELRKALMKGLEMLGDNKPKNAIRFLGDFLVSYKQGK